MSNIICFFCGNSGNTEDFLEDHTCQNRLGREAINETDGIDWSDYGVYEHELPTNWQHVATIDVGSYEWATFHAFYSPTSRRYFWLDDAGCSCSSWGDYVRSEADFHNGTKTDLIRAVHSFTAENSEFVSPADVLDTLATIRTWRPNG